MLWSQGIEKWSWNWAEIFPCGSLSHSAIWSCADGWEKIVISSLIQLWALYPALPTCQAWCNSVRSITGGNQPLGCIWGILHRKKSLSGTVSLTKSQESHRSWLGKILLLFWETGIKLLSKWLFTPIYYCCCHRQPEKLCFRSGQR